MNSTYCHKLFNLYGPFGAHDKETEYDKIILSWFNPVFGAPIGYDKLNFFLILSYSSFVISILSFWWVSKPDRNINHHAYLLFQKLITLLLCIFFAAPTTSFSLSPVTPPSSFLPSMFPFSSFLYHMLPLYPIFVLLIFSKQNPLIVFPISSFQFLFILSPCNSTRLFD